MFYSFCAFLSRATRSIDENGFLRSVFIVMPKPLHERIYKLLVDEKQEKKDGQAETLIVSLTAIGLVVVVLMAVLAIVDWVGHSEKSDWLGTFGDFFGGVLNPLLTFGTFIGLSITIILQRVQLHDARVQYQKNLAAANVQTFETSFFNLINLHNSIVEGLRFDPKVLLPNSHQKEGKHGSTNSDERVEGRQVFAAILKVMQRGLGRKVLPEDVYQEIQDRHNYILGHYFRNLYQIIKLVDRHRFGGAEGERDVDFYRGIIRAQLSSNELLLLFYNCRKGKMDSDKFLDLVRDYALLEHVPLLITRNRQKLVVPTFGELALGLFWPFLEFDQKDVEKPVSMGAFGKNKVIEEFLVEKKLFTATETSLLSSSGGMSSESG